MSRQPWMWASALLLGLSLPSFAEEAAHVHGSDAGAAVPANQSPPDGSAPPKPTGKALSLPLEGGGSAIAYVARPKQAATGGVLVLHEWWGLNDFVKGAGGCAGRPGLPGAGGGPLPGQVATTPDEAGKLMQGLDAAHAAAVEKAGVAWLKHTLHGKKIATLGWCAGGGQSLLASLGSPEAVSATVMYYGMPVTDVAQLKTLRGPLLGIWAKKRWVDYAGQSGGLRQVAHRGRGEAQLPQLRR